MAIVKFVQRDGAATQVEIEGDVSVMVAALRNGIRGIEGECGGCIDCATCHVYLDEAQSQLMPSPTEAELDLLSGVGARRKPTSRLGCQLKVPPSIDELVVYVPESQS